MMKLKINHNSVSMAEDIDDHSTEIEIDVNLSFHDLIIKLIQINYFPHVYGNDVVWVLQCKDEDYVSYVTITGKIYTVFNDANPSVESFLKSKKTDEISFKYYSSQLKRAESIFKSYGCSKYQIWHEGFMPEYESYHISHELEEHWT